MLGAEAEGLVKLELKYSAKFGNIDLVYLTSFKKFVFYAKRLINSVTFKFGFFY